MIRKIVIFVCVVFFMSLLLFAGMMYLTDQAEVYSDNEITLRVEKPTFFTVSDPQASESGTDTIYEHDLAFLGLSLGTYTLVERTLENGVVILFEEVNNTSWMPYALSLDATGLDGGEVKSWNPEPVSPEEDPVFGEDPTSNPFGTITWDGHELLQGNVFVSRQLTLGNGSEVQELRHEMPNAAFEEGSILKNFWLPPKHQSHSWMMIAQEPFFESEETEDEWINFALDNRRQQLNWLTPEGPLVKLPLTDDPRTQMAYGLIPERTADPASAEWNEHSPSLFFETMKLNSQVNQEQ